MSKGRTQFRGDIDAVSHDELKRLYRSLLSSRDGLKQHNDRLTKWAGALNDAVTTLATEGSLAFQAMAEKAGVRSHPSVTEAVRLFDAVSHPQWREEGCVLPKITWPDEWDLDAPDAWSGDADMMLNSPISDAIELFRAMLFDGTSARFREHAGKVAAGLERALRDGVEGIKSKSGFVAKTVDVPVGHYRDMNEDELRSLVGALGWMALDLAQDMGFANEMLRRDLRASSYRQICSNLYAMSQFAVEPEPGCFDIKVMGAVEAT